MFSYPGLLFAVGCLLVGLPPGDAGSGFVGGQLLTEDDQEPQDDYYYYEDDDYSRIVSLLAAKLRENEASSEKHHSPEGYQHKWWSGYVDDYPDETSVAQHKRSSKVLRRQRGVPGCLRRGANCDHRPHQCCQQSACRCNLWGANCRCQRRGLFQKWGK